MVAIIVISILVAFWLITIKYKKDKDENTI